MIWTFILFPKLTKGHICIKQKTISITTYPYTSICIWNFEFGMYNHIYTCIICSCICFMVDLSLDRDVGCRSWYILWKEIQIHWKLQKASKQRNITNSLCCHFPPLFQLRWKTYCLVSIISAILHFLVSSNDLLYSFTVSKWKGYPFTLWHIMNLPPSFSVFEWKNKSRTLCFLTCQIISTT